MVGVFHAVVQVAVLAVLDAGQELSYRRTIAFELIGHDHAWHIGQPHQELAEESLRGLLIPPALYQDVENIPLLIYGPPEVMAFPVDRQAHFIHMPRVTGLRPPMPERIRIGLAELAAPLPNRLIRQDAPGEEEFLHVAVAETEPEIEPDAMADDLGREAVVLIAVG